MANSSFNAEGVQFAWDATSIGWAQTCLQYYEYKMLGGYQSRGANVHLRFGGHYATALEHFYKNMALGMDREEALIAIVHEALCDTWDRSEANPAGEPWDSGDTNKTRETLIRTIVWYEAHFANDPTPVIHLSNGKPAVEYSFSVEVDNGLVFSGHIDRLVTYHEDIYVMDQKTTGGTIGPYYFEQFSPNTQMSMYSFAGQIMYGSPVMGVIVDAAQIAVGFSRFERGFTHRTQAQLNEWYDSAMYHIAQAQKATRDHYFPMNPSSCGNYGGCPFRKICNKPAALRKNFLAADFEQLPAWDPLERR